MPQTLTQWLSGYVTLTVDTFGQRIFDHSPPPGHTLFPSKLPSQTANVLRGHVSVVTGANTGIGFATARHLAALGATVILACRNVAKASAAADAIRRLHTHADVEVGILDLASHDSVRRFAAPIAAHRRLDSLILNGGVMGVDQTDPETHLSINHVAHALLTLLLLPALDRAQRRDHVGQPRPPGTGAFARVVAVSSLTARISDLRLDDLSFAARRYRWMTAYANSKLCMLLFAHALGKRLKGSRVCVNAVHPGEAPSDVARHLGAIAVAGHKYLMGPLCLLPVADAARTSVYAAAAPEVVGSGSFFYRTCRVLRTPPHLLNDADADAVWQMTIKMAGITDDDLAGLRALQGT